MVVAATIAPVLNVAYCSFSTSLSLSFLFMFAFVDLTRIDVFPFFSWIPLWVILSLLRQPVPRSSVLSLWQSSGIHPCGDFLFVGTTHQATPQRRIFINDTSTFFGFEWLSHVTACQALRMYDLQTLSCFTTSHQDQHHTAGLKWSSLVQILSYNSWQDLHQTMHDSTLFWKTTLL